MLDIGTGTGLIALMLAQRAPEAHVTGVDIDDVGQAARTPPLRPGAEGWRSLNAPCRSSRPRSRSI